jgi:hypothetical protein
LPPPFGQLRVTTAQVFHVTLWLHRIGQHTHHVNNGKPPLLVLPDTTNGGFLKYRDVVRGFVGGDDFLHIAPSKTVILYSSLQLHQSLFLASAMASAA